MVDPERMSAARKSAMLERAELSDLSKILELTKIANSAGVETGDAQDVAVLRSVLNLAGINLTGKRIGISRDELAKLETGGRKRPRITTLRKFLDTINHAREQRGKPPIDVEDLQVPGEVLIPAPREPGQWNEEMETTYADPAALPHTPLPGSQEAIDAYQQASNEIYYLDGVPHTQGELEIKDVETGT